MAATEKDNRIALPDPVSLSTYVVTCALLSVTAAIMVALKLSLTWRARRRFGTDDAMILAGLLTLVATGVMGAEAYDHGLGKPTTLIDGKYPSWRAFYWEYIFYTVWFVPLCFSKLAFFFMYTRTFQGKKMKRTLWVSMIIFTALTILFITGTQLLSQGIADSHGPNLDPIKALRYHVQFKYLHYAWGTCDILADLWICVLPLAGLKVLKIGLKRRLELTLKFAVPALTFVVSMIRIYELNLVMSRDIMLDHTWDPQIAETVPVLWALIQAFVAVIITTLPSLALRISAFYRQTQASRASAVPQTEPVDPQTGNSETSKEETVGGRTPTTSFAPTLNSEMTSSHKSNRSKAEKILGMSQRLKRSRTLDEYSEDDHRMDSISGITVTRTVDVTSTLDPEEGFKHMYRKYCGQA